MDMDNKSAIQNETNNRPKRSVLNLLSKRSTKVEPQQFVENAESETNIPVQMRSTLSQQSASAQSTPIKRNTDTCLRSFNSSQNISSNNNNNNNTGIVGFSNLHLKPKLFSASNRLSHQFGICCSIDERDVTPPITVRYKSLPEIEVPPLKSPHPAPLPLALDQIQQIHNQNGQNIFQSTVFIEEHQAIVHHSPPPPPLESPESLNKTKNKTLHSDVHKEISFTSTSSAPDTAKPPNRPVFNEFHNSIAVSACRSRLREKILIGAPIKQIELQSNASSYPNVYSNVSKPVSLDLEPNDVAMRSISYDGLTRTSTNSLAKQSLIAAQLLNLIPTEKARERNYLSGRLAVTSLFGLAELERVLPTKEVKIFVGTWNMNEQNPPKQMNDFVLPNSIDHIPDLVVIGTQESCSVRFEWEVTLQETLGPSHILLHSASLGTLHLAVFIRRDLIWFCSEPEDDSLSVRPGTAFRTKGAVAISFCLFGTTMLFVTSHLTAHQQKVKERVQDVKRIIHSLDLPRNLNIRQKNRDVTQNFDCVYWCGDLNFRLGEPREKVLKWIETTKFPLPSHMPNGYMHTDQLKSVLANGAAFKDFKEAHITFPPTYKYDPGTQNFDTSSKQRTPAYTDRILFKYKSIPSGIRRGSNLAALLHSAQVECVAYDSVPSITTSDHKPVWALFKNPIRPGIDSVPLAAGLFNRDVYLEGMKRRLNNSKYEGSSAVCSIQ